MDLSTMRYLEPVPETGPILPPGSEDLSWTEVTKGLLMVLAGYVLAGINLFGMGIVIWVVTDELTKSIEQVNGNSFSLLLVSGSLSFFVTIYTAYLILRGKWRCMMNAPEQRSAKWLMFASMICICAGPALHGMATLADATRQQKPARQEAEYKPSAEKTIIRFTERVRTNDSSSYLRLLGSLITPLGPVFFVLFLRAIQGCLGSLAGSRLSELYLLFLGLLLATSLCLLLDPRVKIRLDLLKVLALSWLFAALWYFLLIVGAVFTISAHLNAPREPVQSGA